MSFLTSTLAATLPPSQRTFAQPPGKIAAYFTLQFFGFVSLSVLLATFVTRRVKRDKTIWSLLAVFMVATSTTSLVFISGTLLPDSEGRDRTPYGLCLVNAGFILGGTTSMSAAALNIVLNILLRIIAAKGRLTTLVDSKALAIWFLVSPWVCWLCFVVATVIVGDRDPDKVYKAVFYCAIDNDSLVTASTVSNAIFEVMNLLVQVAIGVILYLHHRSLTRLLGKSHPLDDEFNASQLQSRTSRTSSTTLGGVSIPLIIRLGLFQLCVIAALGVAIAVEGDFTSLLGDFCITAIGPLVFFIFSSQADVLRAWHLLPAETPTTTLPFTTARSNPNTNTNTDDPLSPTSSESGHRRAPSANHTQPTLAAAYDFSTTTTVSSSSSRAPKLPVSSNEGQEFALDTLRFDNSSRSREASSSSSKRSISRTRTRSVAEDQSSVDESRDEGDGGGRGEWGSQVALRGDGGRGGR